ncbi:helix-turn-helix domain-containing protein [Furfurilactobacillus sp. WILCCON 0119]
MNKEDLLEPFERRQIRILQYVYRNNGRAQIGDIAKEMRFSSRRLLMDDLQSIKNVLEENLKKYRVLFEWDDNTVTFEINGRVSLKTLIFPYYLQTAKIRLIEHLVLDNNLTNIQLARELNLSVATLYRKIGELNELFEVFNVTITHFELTGDEVNVQLLLFELLWNVCPKDQFIYKRYLLKNTRAAQAVRRLTDDPHYQNLQLSVDAPRKLYTWLLIIRTRRRNASQSQDLEGWSTPYAIMTSHLMRDNSQFEQLWSLMDQTALLPPSETLNRRIKQHFLMFCLAHEIFSSKSNFWTPLLTAPADEDQLVAMTHQIQERYMTSLLKKQSVETKQYTLKYLYHVLVNVVVFPGHVNLLRPATTRRYYERLQNEQIIHWAQDLSEKIAALVKEQFEIDVNLDYLVQLMVVLQLNARHLFATHLRVAVDPGIGAMWLQPFIQACQSFLNQTLQATVEVFQPHRHYDLYLSDHFSDRPIEQADRTYILTDLGSEADFKKIVALLQAL